MRRDAAASLGEAASSTRERHTALLCIPSTVRHRGVDTGISEASMRVSIFSFATQGGKQVSSYFRQGNWVQAREARTGSDPAPYRLA